MLLFVDDDVSGVRYNDVSINKPTLENSILVAFVRFSENM